MAISDGGFGVVLSVRDNFTAPLNKYRTQIMRSRAATQAFTAGLRTSAVRMGIAAVAVAGAGYAFYRAIKPGVEFEKQMREVSAVTGATAKEFKAMTAVAKKLGIETVFSAKAAAGAMYMLGSRGVKTARQFEILLIPAMDLAAALKFDLVRATEMMMATLKMFDMEMTDATKVADLLTNAYKNSAANAEKLAISMNYAGFAFSAVGYTLRETLVPLEALYDLGLEASMAGCYDEKTEVLTSTGFKFWPDVTKKDLICTLNPQTKNIEYQKSTALVNEKYHGRMYRVKNKHVNLLVTPDHWMYVRKEHRKGFERIQAKDIFGKRIEYLVAGEWKGQEEKFFILPRVERKRGYFKTGTFLERKLPMDTFLEFFGYWITEGWTVRNEKQGQYRAGIRQKDPIDRKKMFDCCQKLFKCYIDKKDTIHISSKQLYEYLVKFGHATQKYLPSEFKKLSRRQLQILLEAMILGDGDKKRKRTVWTSSLKLRDDLEEVILKVGYGVSHTLVIKKGDKRKIEDREITASADGWAVNINRTQLSPHFDIKANKQASKNDKTLERWEFYKGRIYCAVVPNHVMFIRREGKTVWCGNTALRKSISALIKPTREAGKALMGMGLSTADVSPELHSFIEIIETLEEANMSTADALTIFGQRAGPAMAKLVSMGADALREYDAALGATGVGSEEAQRLLAEYTTKVEETGIVSDVAKLLLRDYKDAVLASGYGSEDAKTLLQAYKDEIADTGVVSTTAEQLLIDYKAAVVASGEESEAAKLLLQAYKDEVAATGAASETAKQLLSDYEEALKTSGSASETAREQLKGFQGALTLIKSSLEGVWIALEEFLAPALEEATRWITENINTFLKWIISSEGMVKGIQDFAKEYGSMISNMLKPSLSLFKNLVTTVMTLIGTWSKMNEAQKEFVMRGVKVATILSTVAIAVAILGPAVLGLVKAFQILGISGLLVHAKFLLIIAGIISLIAIGVLLKEKWKAIWDLITLYVSVAWLKITSLRWEGITTAANLAWLKIKAFVAWVRDVGIVPAIIQIVHAGWNWIASIAKRFADWVWPYIEPLIKSQPVQAVIGVMHKAWIWLGSIAKRFADWVKPYIDKLIATKPVQAVVGVIHKAWIWIKSIAIKFVDWVKPFIEDVLELPVVKIVAGIILEAWHWIGTQAGNLWDWFMEQYETASWGKLSLGIIGIAPLVLITKYLLFGALPWLSAWLLGKMTAAGMISLAGIIPPIGLIAAIAILAWKITPESADRFWNYWHKELPDKLAEKIKPATIFLLDVLIAIITFKLSDESKANFLLTWHAKVVPALKALVPSLLLSLPLFIATWKVFIDPEVAVKVREVLNAIRIDPLAPMLFFGPWAISKIKLIGVKNLGVHIVGKMAEAIAKAAATLKGLNIWDILIGVWTKGLPHVIRKIKRQVAKITDAFVFPTKALGAFSKNLDAFGEAAIANIDEIADIVEERVGADIPDSFKTMTLALIASESSFERNAENIDRLGKAYQGWGQLGKAAIKDLERLGIVIKDINDPTENLTGTMAYFRTVLQRTDEDIEKAILTYKGWGNELAAAGGNIKKLPEEAQRQLRETLRIFRQFMGEIGMEVDEGMEYVLFGRSPGGLVGSFEEAKPLLSNTFQGLTSILGDFMTKIYDYLKTVPGLGEFLGKFEDLIALFKSTEEEAKELIKALTEAGKTGEEAAEDIVDSWSLVLGEISKLNEQWPKSLTKMWGYIHPLMQKEQDKELSDWNSFLSQKMDVTYDTYDALMEALSDLTDKDRELLEESFEDWKGWGRNVRGIAASVIKGLAGVVEGTKTVGEVLYNLVGTIPGVGGLIQAIWDLVGAIFGAKEKADDFLDSFTGSMDTAIRRTEIFNTKAEDLKYTWDRVAVVFEQAGHRMSGSIQETQKSLEELHRRQLDLEMDTRGKLLSELDKYYDYRILKEMDLTQLLELSAETRGKIETDSMEKSLEKRIQYLQGLVDAEEATDAQIKELDRLRAESAKETAEREKDAKLGTLTVIEEAYKKEDELIKRKIALTEIEIKVIEFKMEREAHGHSDRYKQLESELFQMLKNYHLSVEAYKGAEKKKQGIAEETTEILEEEAQKQIKITEKATKVEVRDIERSTEIMSRDFERVTEEIVEFGEKGEAAIGSIGDEAEIVFGREGRVSRMFRDASREMVANMRNTINTMIRKMGELPTRIYFDVIGILHMPSIPGIPTQYFDIFGIYHAPSIPSYQTGVYSVPETGLAWLHKEEEVKSAGRVRIESVRGARKEGDVNVDIRMHNVTFTSEADENRWANKLARQIKDEVMVR